MLYDKTIVGREINFYFTIKKKKCLKKRNFAYIFPPIKQLWHNRKILFIKYKFVLK